MEKIIDTVILTLIGLSALLFITTIMYKLATI
jgi:hypothetical protein